LTSISTIDGVVAIRAPTFATASANGIEAGDVAEQLDPKSTEPGKHDRPPLRIAACTDEAFESGRRHRLDENAVEHQIRRGLRNLRVERRPGTLQLSGRRDVNDHTAGFRLVNQRRRLCFEYDRISKFARNVARHG
jgi:hypothetical protein